MDDALFLARVQFGLNIAFHILFPTITIGLAWLIAWFRLRYEQTRDPAWLETYRRFWDQSLDRLDLYLKKLQEGDSSAGSN